MNPELNCSTSGFVFVCMKSFPVFFASACELRTLWCMPARRRRRGEKGEKAWQPVVRKRWKGKSTKEVPWRHRTMNFSRRCATGVFVVLFSSRFRAASRCLWISCNLRCNFHHVFWIQDHNRHHQHAEECFCISFGHRRNHHINFLREGELKTFPLNSRVASTSMADASGKIARLRCQWTLLADNSVCSKLNAWWTKRACSFCNIESTSASLLCTARKYFSLAGRTFSYQEHMGQILWSFEFVSKLLKVSNNSLLNSDLIS